MERGFQWLCSSRSLFLQSFSSASSRGLSRGSETCLFNAGTRQYGFQVAEYATLPGLRRSFQVFLARVVSTIAAKAFTLHMNRRVMAFGISVELLSSFLLYGRAPTDGVRVWYPSVWAYMGEHGLVWGILVGVLFAALRNRTIGEAFTALARLVSELVATLYVWFVIPREGEISRAWIGKFSDYFTTRLTAWCVLAALASLVYWTLYKRAPRKSQVPSD